MTRIKLLFALLITLLSVTSRAQDKIKVLELKGTRTAITPRLSKWKPNFSDPVLKIKTRDEKGLIFSRNVQPFKMTNYHNGSTGEDPAWQQQIRITENTSNASAAPS